MLSGGNDALYRAALASSHSPYLNVQVLDGSGTLLRDDLPYETGTVSATLTSSVSRTLELTLDESFYPFDSGDLLAPYGNRIRAWRGVQFADGNRFAWVVFTGRIQRTAMTDSGTVQVHAADRAADVAEHRFLSPQNSQAGSLIDGEVQRIITDALPDAVFGDFDIFDILVAPMTWQLERTQALNEIGSSVGAFWYPLADGRFVMRRYPWTVPGSPVVTYSDGEGGTVTGSRPARSRETVFNSLTVTGERLDGSAPVFATATDDNPESPTFIDGNFGRRHALARLQTVATIQAAQNAARNNLQRLIALQDSWTWTMIPDAALELGDVVALAVRDRIGVVQVVSSLQLPLNVGSLMTVQGRAQTLGILEGVG